MKPVKLGVVAVSVALAMPAFGADLPRRAPITKAPPPAAVSYNWSGCYVGGHVGYGWSGWQDRDLPNARALADIGGTPANQGDPIVFGYGGKYETDGFVGGGQVGCDQQYGFWVLGLVADVSWTSQKDTVGPFAIVPTTPPLSVDEFGTVKLKYFGTARGRVGYATGPWLFYGTGGLAWAKGEASVRGEAFVPFTTIPFSTSDSAFHIGWAAGLGVEWMFAPNWTVGLEYLHLEFGDANYRYSGPFPNTTTTFALAQGTKIDLDSDIVRATLNYRFAPIR
jgi:outer membrane immunogenic protein